VPKESERERVLAEIKRLLREARENQNLSMNQLAAKAGMSQQMVSYVERQMRQPTVDTLLRLTDALGLDPAQLFTQASTTGARAKKKRQNP
jgi:transcriptional regulator with XRE-family HTH domain